MDPLAICRESIIFLDIEKCEAIRCRKPIISQTLFSNLRYQKL